MMSAVLLGMASTNSWAALGSDESSISHEAQGLGGDPQVTHHEHYSVHEMSRQWSRVREYAAGNGKVFALAWKGKTHPDLSGLMGPYLKDFKSAIGHAREHVHHGGVLSISENGLHVEMGGHMGAVYGRVWLEDQVPAGMDLGDVQ